MVLKTETNRACPAVFLVAQVIPNYDTTSVAKHLPSDLRLNSLYLNLDNKGQEHEYGVTGTQLFTFVVVYMKGLSGQLLVEVKQSIMI